MPFALKALAVALVVLAVVGAGMTAAGFARTYLPDVVRGGSLVAVALVCLAVVLIRGRRRSSRR